MASPTFTTAGPAAALIATLTAGLVIGISFIAQPVKFTAADVALAQQVRIGSVIFHASHLAQWALLVGLAAALFLVAARPAWAWASLAAIALCLLVQSVVLMPLFDARVAALSAGHSPAPQPWLHGSYIGLEVLKLLTLAWLSWASLFMAGAAARLIEGGPQ